MIVKINRDFYRVMSRNGKYIKRSRNVRLAGFSAAALLFIYALLAVFPVCFQDKDAEAAIVPSETTLAIVSSKDTASVEITPTSGAGTFATSAAADKAEFTVTTDNLTGYSLNLVGSDTSGQLVNATTGDTLDTLTADVSETTFRTGAAETYANKWGYQLNVNSTTTTDFLAAPTTSTKTIYTTTGPNTSADNYTLGVGARVDYSKAEGTYTNTFVLTAVGNPISYQINYLDNTGEGGTTGEDVSDLPTAEGSANITASSFTLATGTPSRTGYNFVGWCYGTVNHNDDPSSCDGTTYQPGDTFTFTSIPSTGTATANLYAMWESDDTVTMQDLTPSQCTTTPTAFKDKRDGEEYTVAKINGNCWMTQNLRYVGDTGSTSTSMIMKAATSNIASDQTLTIGDLTLGDDQNNARIHVATPDQVPSGASYDATDMGVWYNYAAASAMTITGSSNSTNAIYDICPKGWRLPTHIEQSNITTSQANAYHAIAGGYYWSGSPQTATTFGAWWASTAADETYRYSLRWYNSSMSTPYDNRIVGYYVRCILKPQTMQSFTTADADTMTAGETRTLRDSRDGKEYKVAKLADGNVWMTENLNLAGGTALSADDTDVTSEYISGFSTQGNLTKNANNTISLPSSSTSGFNDNSNAYVYNTSSTTCGNGNPCYGYYSWIAATLGGKASNGSTAVTGNGEDAAASICPKGWKLPSSGNYNDASDPTTTGYKKGDFYKMILAVTGQSSLTNGYYESTANFYNAAGPGKVPNFLLAGFYTSGSFNAGGSNGTYWSSSSYSSANAYSLYFHSSYVSSADYSNRYGGFAVRCMLSDERTLDDITYLQDMNSGIASRTATGAMKTLIDKRDNQQYTVQKLADGKVWMMDNLNLGAIDLTQDLTSENTNCATSGSTACVATNMSGTPSLTAANFNSYEKTSGSGTYTAPEYIPVSGNDTTMGTPGVPYGTLYNYCAASAGTICNSSNSSNASYDLCPAGWRLPTGNTSGEFQTLYNQSAYNSNANMRKSYENGGAAFALAGYFSTSTPTYQGSNGYYWSSTRYNNTNMYYLYLNTSDVNPARINYRSNGFSIRCVLK